MSGIRDSAVANGSAVGSGGIGVGPFDVVDGDAICVQVCDPNPNVTVEDDNGGSTTDYVEVNTFQEATPNINRVRLWVRKNATGGSVTVTVKFTSGSGDPTCIAASGEGLTTDPVDTGSHAKGTDGSSPFEINSAGQGQADNLMVLAVCSGETSHNSYVGTNGFTMVQEGTNDGLYWPGAFLVQDVSQTAAVTGGFTNSGASNTGLKIVALKEAAEVTIVTQPTSQQVDEGNPATFSVVTADGSPQTYTYQWQYNTGTGWQNVSTGTGGTGPTWVTHNTVKANDDYTQVRCAVTNGATTVYTDTVVLRVAAVQSSFSGSGWVMGHGQMGDMMMGANVVAASSDFNATANKTEDNDTPSATGTVLVSGTASKTEANDTPAATGTVLVSGSASKTEADDTPSAAGQVLVSGAAGKTEDNDTGTGSGGPVVGCAASKTEDNDTGSAAGTVLVSGSGSKTEDNDTSGATGTVSVSGSGSKTEDDDTGAADINGDTRRFTGASTEDNDTPNATGTVLVSAVAAATEASDTPAATAAVVVSGVVGSQQAGNTGASSGTVFVGCAAAATEANDTPAATATVAVSGTASKTEDNDTPSATGNTGAPRVGVVASTEDNDSGSAAGDFGSPVAPTVPAGTSPGQRLIRVPRRTSWVSPVEPPRLPVVHAEANAVQEDAVCSAHMEVSISPLDRRKRLALLAA